MSDLRLRCNLLPVREEVMARDARPARGRSKTAPAAVCSSSCRTKDHKSWGECVRAKGLNLSPAINDGYSTRQRAWDGELDNYESAVRQGLSPAGTRQHHVDAALREAEE